VTGIPFAVTGVQCASCVLTIDKGLAATILAIIRHIL
jgi:hypothetical protein